MLGKLRIRKVNSLEVKEEIREENFKQMTKMKIKFYETSASFPSKLFLRDEKIIDFLLELGIAAAAVRISEKIR
jgi:hypothetical protein